MHISRCTFFFKRISSFSWQTEGDSSWFWICSGKQFFMSPLRWPFRLVCAVTLKAVFFLNKRKIIQFNPIQLNKDIFISISTLPKNEYTELPLPELPRTSASQVTWSRLSHPVPTWPSSRLGAVCFNLSSYGSQCGQWQPLCNHNFFAPPSSKRWEQWCVSEGY